MTALELLDKMSDELSKLSPEERERGKKKLFIAATKALNHLDAEVLLQELEKVK